MSSQKVDDCGAGKTGKKIGPEDASKVPHPLPQGRAEILYEKAAYAQESWVKSKERNWRLLITMFQAVYFGMTQVLTTVTVTATLSSEYNTDSRRNVQGSSENSSNEGCRSRRAS